MAVAVRGKYKFQALTQRETLMAHRTGKFPYACINVVSGDEDSLFLAAVYDNTKNGHRYRYVELTELIKDIKCEFPHVNEWEIARLVGAEPDLVKKVLTEIQNW